MIVDYSHIGAFIIGVFIGSLVGNFIASLVKDVYNIAKEYLRYRKDTREIPIKLEFKNVAENEKELLALKYSVLLVRYGKDEVKEAEELLNKEIEFEGYNPKIARIRVHKVLGAQFKCFVDYKSKDQFDIIKKLLEKNGFREVTHDDDRYKKRAWFIHPGFSACKTVDGYVNNFAHPSEYRR